MAIEYLSATLQVWRYAGAQPRPEEFLDQLVIDADDNVKKRKTPHPRVEVLSIELRSFAEANEPTEAFAEELNQRLLKAADWLNKQPPALFNELRSLSFQTRLLFTGWIDSDQLDLDLPPTLLEACGKLGLTLSVITND